MPIGEKDAPIPPTAPAAPVTRIGLSCLCFVVMSLTLGYGQKTNWHDTLGIGEPVCRMTKSWIGAMMNEPPLKEFAMQHSFARTERWAGA